MRCRQPDEGLEGELPETEQRAIDFIAARDNRSTLSIAKYKSANHAALVTAFIDKAEEVLLSSRPRRRLSFSSHNARNQGTLLVIPQHSSETGRATQAVAGTELNQPRDLKDHFRTSGAISYKALSVRRSFSLTPLFAGTEYITSE